MSAVDQMAAALPPAVRISRRLYGLANSAVRVVWEYLKFTRGVPLVLQVLAGADKAGIAYLAGTAASGIFFFPKPHIGPEALLMLSSNPVVVGYTAAGLSPLAFFTIGFVRLTIADVLNYYVGLRSLDFLRQKKKKRVVRWLEDAPRPVLWLMVAVCTFFPVPLMSVYMVAGLTRLNFKLLMSLNALVTVAQMLTLYRLGG